MDSRLEKKIDEMMEAQKKKIIKEYNSERMSKVAEKLYKNKSPEEISAMRKKGWETRRKKNEGNS